MRIPVLRWDDESLLASLAYSGSSRAAWPRLEFQWAKSARDALRVLLRPAWALEVPQLAVLPVNPLRLLENMRDALPRGPPLTPLQHARWMLHLLQEVRRLHWRAAARAPRPQDFCDPRTLHQRDLPSRLRQELTATTSIHARPELRAQAAFALLLSGPTMCQDAAVSQQGAEDFSAALLLRYARGIVSPGEGVGAVGASSIGEPSTQGALNVFHYSGIAGTNITTSGLPRFKQLINAVNTSDSANMMLLPSAPFNSEAEAQAAAKRLCSTRLADIVASARTVRGDSSAELGSLDRREALLMRGAQFTGTGASSSTAPLVMCARKKLQARLLQREEASDELQSRAPSAKPRRGAAAELSALSPCKHAVEFELDKSAMVRKALEPWDVALSLQQLLGLDCALVLASEEFEDRWLLRVRPLRTLQMSSARDDSTHAAIAEAFMDALMGDVVVRGLSSVSTSLGLKVTRDAVCADTGGMQRTSEWAISTLGSDLHAAALLPGMDLRRIMSNNVQEVCAVLGIEAAVSLVASELQRTLCFEGSYVDPRHPQLLADTQGRGGAIMALNCHNMEDMGSSLLQRASFERTLPVLQCAALFAQSDVLGGATEKQIVGLPVHVGTGVVEVMSSEPLPLPASHAYVGPLARKRVSVDGLNSGMDSGPVMPLSVVAGSTESCGVAPLGILPMDEASDEETFQVKPMHAGALRAGPLHAWHPVERGVLMPPAEQLAVETSLASVLEDWHARAMLGQGVLLRTRLTAATADQSSRIERRLHSFLGWDSAPQDGGWEQVSDISYADGRGREVHTLVEHGGMSSGHLLRNHVHKTVLSSWQLAEGLSATLLAEEQVRDLPAAVDMARALVKQRKVFEHGGWAYVLCRWWSGASLLDAEDRQRREAPTWDVRIELWKPQTALAATPSLARDAAARWWSLLHE